MGGSLIRQARVTDAPDLCTLALQLGYVLAVEESIANLDKLMAHSDYEAVVATLDGHTVGWMVLHHRIRLEGAPYLEIAAIVTDEKFRGRGLGRQLVAYAEARAVASGLSCIALYSNVERIHAHRFYAAAGFVKTKTSGFFRKDVSGC